jgi:hypothetical protein
MLIRSGGSCEEYTFHMTLIGAVVAEKMIGNFSADQRPAFSGKSVKRDQWEISEA